MFYNEIIGLNDNGEIVSTNEELTEGKEKLNNIEATIIIDNRLFFNYKDSDGGFEFLLVPNSEDEKYELKDISEDELKNTIN